MLTPISKYLSKLLNSHITMESSKPESFPTTLIISDAPFYLESSYLLVLIKSHTLSSAY